MEWTYSAKEAQTTQITETKRNLDGRVRHFVSDCLLLDSSRAILLYEIDEPEIVAGRLELPSGTCSYGYFWLDRSYNVYHWLHEGKTLAYYINLGRCRSITDRELVWDDYAVDVLVRPSGDVEVLDEDELPENVDPSIRRFVTKAQALVFDQLEQIIQSVERETRAV